jgi:hypothetical protein
VGCVGGSHYRVGHRHAHRDHYDTDQVLDYPDDVEEIDLVAYHPEENATDVDSPEGIASGRHVIVRPADQPNCSLAPEAGMENHSPRRLHWHLACSTTAERWSIDRAGCLEQPKAGGAGTVPEDLDLTEQDSEATREEPVAEGEMQQEDSEGHLQDCDFVHHY